MTVAKADEPGISTTTAGDGSFVLAGLPSVRIVHGKGEGILRKMTHDYLRKHPHVSKFQDADASLGGAGVTVAYLK